ncbi:hypothetical protein [Rubinisphaera italica]|nr:hypothetical protein [Rubinisphaera italica]
MALRGNNYLAISRFVFLGGAIFRLILLPSYPIQEVDIYRYLWDGAVVSHGDNPYRLSPQQVLHSQREESSSAELTSLANLKDSSRSLSETLNRIHFGELITVYPPVSQAVFGTASLVVPDNASLYQRVITMKTVLTAFDLGTLLLVLLLLRRMNRHPGWAILYGWCPLVLKEFANSGHLDSIAVFLTTAAILALIIGIAASQIKWQLLWLACSSLFLGLGVGAKLYPVILIPVLTLWVSCTLSRRIAVGYFASLLVIAGFSLVPMLATAPAATTRIIAPVEADKISELMPTDEDSAIIAESGLVTFLSRWEINDLFFMVIVENLRPDIDFSTLTDSTSRSHWFVIIPQSLRLQIASQLSAILQCPIPEATFLAARAITLIIFMSIVAILLRRAVQNNNRMYWLRVSFLTIAWFWALSPTLNPWYWTWAIPLLPFAGRRAWTAVSLLIFAYYIRFWILYHVTESNVLGTGYHGEEFFHFVIAPLEHLLWLALLGAESFFYRNVCVVTEADTTCDIH